MGMNDIRRRLAALEKGTEITRPCIAFPRDEAAEFLGYAVAPLFVQPWHDPAENFEVRGADLKECASRAEAMSHERWTSDPLLFVRLDPLTNPPTYR